MMARTASDRERLVLRASGAPLPPVLEDGGAREASRERERASEEDGGVPIVVNGMDADVDADADEDEDLEGVLVDGEDIGPGHVARQEH